ncbi:unnamed protein product [Rotaria sordida]|uniref:Uncharacterized protein n=1 Tax=Rotaria sordida TaxID=392033 RepID=A0A818QQU8_9BILA|nr:unnamed protein product [Rotaria sordida]CAF1103676.1 unnamed protein product [Rotaria sordida]CAF3640785.1 unnamed protein product [Rotaria sordida]CAF4172327.1 unnamed protein product [Rotaria sordida]
MDKNSSNKDESTSSSLMELLRKYTTRVDERETLRQEDTRVYQQQQKVQIPEIEKLKETPHKLQPKTSSTSISNQSTTNLNEEKSNINYKKKWEETEAKYHNLEKKYRQLETGTIKQLQNKIDQLQRDNSQFKLIKERIGEICSCRQLTNMQLEQLKLLVNHNNDLPIETIANKNDFHQQTIKLRDVLIIHNNQLLSRIEEILKRKRKRDQYENDVTDDDDDNNNQ